MNKPFKKLFGNRVYIEMPNFRKQVIEMDATTKEEWMKEELSKLNKLKVYAVGTTIDWLQEGDEVLIVPETIIKAPVIKLGGDKEVLLISPFDIIHLW